VTRKAPRAGSAPPALMELACECASARQAARAITQLYDRWLDGTGLEAPQFALMMALNGHGDASQAAIGRRYGLDKTTISRNLKWLERRGLILATGAEDGREHRSPGQRLARGAETQVEEGAGPLAIRRDRPAMGPCSTRFGPAAARRTGLDIEIQPQVRPFHDVRFAGN
jgi:hypothetical protein